MYSNTAVFASWRVRKRTWWTCSVLSEAKKLLHGRSIEAGAAAAQGLRDAVPLQHRPVGLGCVLHAAVAVVDQPA